MPLSVLHNKGKVGFECYTFKAELNAILTHLMIDGFLNNKCQQNTLTHCVKIPFRNLNYKVVVLALSVELSTYKYL